MYKISSFVSRAGSLLINSEYSSGFPFSFFPSPFSLSLAQLRNLSFVSISKI